MQEMLVCYHDDRDGCECRKPLPGLLLKAAARYTIDLPSSFLIDDRWKDIETGRRAGCRTVLIDYGYVEIGLGRCPPDQTVHSLSEATAWILSRSNAAGGIV